MTRQELQSKLETVLIWINAEQKSAYEVFGETMTYAEKEYQNIKSLATQRLESKKANIIVNAIAMLLDAITEEGEDEHTGIKQ